MYENVSRHLHPPHLVSLLAFQPPPPSGSLHGLPLLHHLFLLLGQLPEDGSMLSTARVEE
jgi:hypothetical protein